MIGAHFAPYSDLDLTRWGLALFDVTFDRHQLIHVHFNLWGDVGRRARQGEIPGPNAIYHQIKIICTVDRDMYFNLLVIFLHGHPILLLDVVSHQDATGELILQLLHGVTVGVAVDYSALDLEDLHQLADTVETFLKWDKFDVYDLGIGSAFGDFGNDELKLVSLINAHVIGAVPIVHHLHFIRLVEAVDQEVRAVK